VLCHPTVKRYLSDEHFSVDGTLIEAWASLKSFRAKDGSDEPPSAGRNGERQFHGETRTNETHASTTDPDAKLYRKGSGQTAKLCFLGHALMENRHGLVVQADATTATSRAEREAALAMIERHAPGSARRLTLGADKGYDTRAFVAGLRRMCVTPHIAAKVRHSAIDARTTRQATYAASQKKRKLVEEAFAWVKTIAGLAKVKVRGPRAGAPPIHVRDGGLQSDPDAETARGGGVRDGSAGPTANQTTPRRSRPPIKETVLPEAQVQQPANGPACMAVWPRPLEAA
jgi:hypothetical protein